jgi:hypothetical protein
VRLLALQVQLDQIHQDLLQAFGQLCRGIEFAYLIRRPAV